MFKPGTVFVVGAGASSEFNLPLGTRLADKIASNLGLRKTDPFRGAVLNDTYSQSRIISRFQGDAPNLNGAFEAANIIREGILHAQSIDAFIDMHHDKPMVSTIGKFQIALEILRSEAGSTLHFDRSNIYNSVNFKSEKNATSWLRVFSEILLEKSRSDDLGSIGSGLTIITFNYDRCIEHYLTHALSKTLAVEISVAGRIVSNIEIIHPYGSLGSIRDIGGRHEDVVPFGASLESPIDIWRIADGISTFTEEMRDEAAVGKIHRAIKSAKRVVFLGFGFQSQNVQLLTPKDQERSGRVMTAMATGYGLHEAAIPEIRSRISKILWDATYDTARESIMVGVGCGDFMRANRLGLAAA